MGILAPTIFFMVTISFNQVFSTNPFFYDPTPYDFKVQDEIVNVYIKEDGGVDIEYFIEFYAYGWSIPIVDIGFPNKYYDLSSVEAELDGNTINPSCCILPSEYLRVGVEIHLGGYTIGSYSSGLLHVTGTDPIMVFKDDLRPFSMASVVFSPTWFSSSFCRGVDHLEVNFYFPEGFTDKDSVIYHNSPYTSYSLNGTHLILTWELNNIPSKQYTFGVSFPKSTVDTVYTSWLCGLFSPIQKVVAILILIAIMVVGILVMRALYVKYKKNAKYRYYKPKVGIECVGVKHELTVVEAAILLGYPLDKVIALIIFGLIRRKTLKLLSIDPPRFKKKTPYPKGLHTYESAFMKNCLVKDPEDKRTYILRESSLKNMLLKLIKRVNRKMKGHSRKETELYYEDIQKNAQTEIISTIDEEEFNNQFEWMLLDLNPKRLEEEYRAIDIFVPFWYHHFFYHHFLKDPDYPIPAGEVSPTRPMRIDGLEFAEKSKESIEYLCKAIVKDLSDFSKAVRKKLFEEKRRRPRSSIFYHRSGVRHGGGGGCACACACACAGCACACAGGGR